MALAKKVEHRTESLDLLRSLSRKQTPEFFERFVELLRVVFDADMAMIVELMPRRFVCRAVATSVRGQRLSSSEQEQKSSIVLDVVRAGRLSVKSQARQKYPHDVWLRDACLEAYHGISLVGVDGQVSAVLAVGHVANYELDRDAEFLLELLAQRVSAEWSIRRVNSEVLPHAQAISHVSAHPTEPVALPSPTDAPIPRELNAGPTLNAEELLARSSNVRCAEAWPKDLAWYRRFFELGTVGMALVGPRGEIWDVNDSLCEMLKRSRQQILCSKWTDLTLTEDLGHEQARLSEVIIGKSEGYSIDKRFRLPDGPSLTTNVSVRCSRNAQGGVDYLAMLAQDVTQQRLLEQQLLHSQKLEAVGRLAGGIAHDFNNLLTAILAYTDITNASDEQAVSEMLSGVRDAALRAANLTSQLLAFARRQVIEPKVLDLNQVVHSTTHLLRRIVGEDIEIVTNTADDLWRVRLDPGQIEQILANLSVNARDAMPNGGRLLIGTGNVPSHTVFEVLGPSVAVQDYVLVMVADTGQGMAPDVLCHLFEPFYTTKDASRGSGLGLATCHGIVSQNGGQIRVTSSAGYGTTFRIYFPRFWSESVTKPSVPPVTQAAKAGETILLVEDDDMVRRVAVRVLKSNGYNVLSATSGIEALEVANKHNGTIELLLTDLVMPKMNGDRLARELVTRRPSTKVLLTSGYAESAFERGVGIDMGFLQKPYTPRQLSERVRKLLDR